MPAKMPSDFHEEAAAAAFAEVLAAEHQAEEAVAACQAQAAQSLAAAHAHQRELSASTERRISAWQKRLHSRAARLIAELERQQAAKLAIDEPDEATQARISCAVAALASELVSED